MEITGRKAYPAGLLFCLVALSPLQAADGYLGAGLGQAAIDPNFFSEYGNGSKIFGGLRLHPYFAVEAAYADFGNPSERLFSIDTAYEAMAVAAWAKAIWPVKSKIDLFGKAGWAHWEIDKTLTISSLPPQPTAYDGNDFAWGLGASFNYWEKFSLQVEYEDINSDLDAITLWSISALYSF